MVDVRPEAESSRGLGSKGARHRVRTIPMTPRPAFGRQSLAPLSLSKGEAERAACSQNFHVGGSFARPPADNDLASTQAVLLTRSSRRSGKTCSSRLGVCESGATLHRGALPGSAPQPPPRPSQGHAALGSRLSTPLSPVNLLGSSAPSLQPWSSDASRPSRRPNRSRSYWLSSAS